MRTKPKGPDFYCIGAQKAGTTWLWANLRVHNEFWLSPIKEIHYFSSKEKYPRGTKGQLFSGPGFLKWRHRNFIMRLLTANYEKADPIVKQFTSEEINWLWQYLDVGFSDDAYMALFDDGKDSISGDFTPNYSLLSNKMVTEISLLTPDAKIIFLMRNPIWRSLSHVTMNKKLISQSMGSKSSFDDNSIIKFTESSICKSFCDYNKIITQWKKYFGSHNLFIGFYDRIKYDPRGLIQEILNFLRVKDIHALDDSPLLFKSINKGEETLYSKRVLLHLAKKYIRQIEFLAKEYGSFANNWLLDTMKILESAPPPTLGRFNRN